MLGREYSKVTSVKPTTCSIFVKGLGCGVLICAFTENIKVKANVNSTNFFIFYSVKCLFLTVVKLQLKLCYKC
ncbi:hypothetical protein GCM10022292_15020 [Winogradskyella damuponensis]|uniref:Uncharacterized protein n=1 Tax=Winogradskyella damuponensis TaxID=943939 RepID=A0ABP8CSF5_9FLAO